MQRIGRWMFNVAAVVSLVLCVAMLALWVRSYWREDLIGRGVSTGNGAFNHYEVWRWHLEVRSGGIRITREHGVNVWFPFGDTPIYHGTDAVHSWAYPYWISDPSEERLHFAGFQWAVDTWTKPPKETMHEVYVLVPIGAPLLATTVMPLLWYRRYRLRRRWDRLGKCGKCGYNLTGNASGICPECGTPVASSEKQTTSAA